MQRPSHPNLEMDAAWLDRRVEDVDRLVDDIERDGMAILPSRSGQGRSSWGEGGRTGAMGSSRTGRGLVRAGLAEFPPRGLRLLEGEKERGAVEPVTEEVSKQVTHKRAPLWARTRRSEYLQVSPYPFCRRGDSRSRWAKTLPSVLMATWRLWLVRSSRMEI